MNEEIRLNTDLIKLRKRIKELQKEESAILRKILKIKRDKADKDQGKLFE